MRSAIQAWKASTPLDHLHRTQHDDMQTHVGRFKIPTSNVRGKPTNSESKVAYEPQHFGVRLAATSHSDECSPCAIIQQPPEISKMLGNSPGGNKFGPSYSRYEMLHTARIFCFGQQSTSPRLSCCCALLDKLPST